MSYIDLIEQTLLQKTIIRVTKTARYLRIIRAKKRIQFIVRYFVYAKIYQINDELPANDPPLNH